VRPLGEVLRLNARVASLALRGRWLRPPAVAADYNLVAPSYNTAWQCHLQPVTCRFLERLPRAASGTTLDLGCGTGSSTRALAAHNPGACVIGVDVSPGMLEVARQTRPQLQLRYVEADMLEFLRGCTMPEVRMIVSTWALGYSHPAAVFAAGHRLLPPGGVLAFIVNYADTLAPVFQAFSRCLFRFPDRVRLAAWPRFPRSPQRLRAQLESHGFRPSVFEEGHQPIPIPEGKVLPWLRQTGILAGFDSMLDLSGPAADFFEHQCRADARPLVHHHAVVVASKA
jgi:trans-aconitate methyltransferase